VQLELDMLGVPREHRGHGVATDLVRHAVAEARAAGVATVRAVVGEGNAASLAALGHAGLAAEGEAKTLLVYRTPGAMPIACLPAAWRETVSAPLAPRECPDVPVAAAIRQVNRRLWDDAGACVAEGQELPVQTLSYKGLWIESLRADSPPILGILARRVVEFAEREGMDKVGYLCPERSESTRATLEEAGFEAVGRYHVLSLIAT
jgi:predicted GNAT family acetyltransferase